MSGKKRRSQAREKQNPERQSASVPVPVRPPLAEISPESSAWERVLPGLLFLWTFLLGCTPLMNFDIWWHLRTGEWILENGRVPLTDLFTYADANQPWTDLHWGFQLLVVALHSMGGVELLVLAKAGCLAATVAIGWKACGSHLPSWAKTLCWILPVICLSGRAVVRPEMLSLIFLALWLWIAVHAEKRPRLIWCLPVIQLLWVNSHGIFILGLIVGGAYFVDRLLRDYWGGHFGLEPAPESPHLIHVIRSGVLSLIACLVNPYFEEGLLFPFVLYRKFSVDQVLYSSVGEFQTLWTFAEKAGYSSLYFDAQILLWIVTGISFGLLFQERRVSILRLLLFAAFSHLAWKASRNTSIFSLVSGVVLCGNLSDYLQLRNASAHSRASDKTVRNRLGLVTGIVLGGLALSIFTGHWAEWGRENKEFGLGEREGWYPHEAVRFAGRPEMPRQAFLAHNGLAAVYEYHNGPERRVFMDGRLEVASRETFQINDDILGMMSKGDPRWQGLLMTQGGELPVVILDSRSSRAVINGMFSFANWRLVFADSSAAVFIETELAETLKLPLADPEPLKHPPGMILRDGG